MDNLLSYCDLTHARMNPSEKDLPVRFQRMYLEKLKEPEVETKVESIKVVHHFRMNYEVI